MVCPDCSSRGEMLKILIDDRRAPNIYAYYCESCGYCWTEVERKPVGQGKRKKR